MKKFAYGLIVGWVARGILETVNLYIVEYSDIAEAKATLEEAVNNIKSGFKGLSDSELGA